jgi:hypothetical protein
MESLGGPKSAIQTPNKAGAAVETFFVSQPTTRVAGSGNTRSRAPKTLARPRVPGQANGQGLFQVWYVVSPKGRRSIDRAGGGRSPCARAHRRPAFNVSDIFASGENVAVFGDFRYRSKSLGKVVSSPFSIHVKVVEGKVTYLQFLEDSYATASSFRKGGSWTVQTEPGTEPYEV